MGQEPKLIAAAVNIATSRPERFVLEYLGDLYYIRAFETPQAKEGARAASDIARRNRCMTIEEVERILQIVAGNQARFTEAQIDNDARQARLDDAVKRLTEAQINNEKRQARLDETLEQITEAHKLLIELVRIQEESLDGFDVAHRATDEKLSALVDAHVGFEARQAKIEESFQLLVQLAMIQEKRIDGHDEAFRQANGKFDALIDAQIRLTERVDTLNGRVDTIGEHLDQAVMQIKALASAQTRTDKQIKTLLARNGATKPVREATTVAKKKATKKVARSQ